MVEMGQGVEPAVQIGEYGTRAAEGFLIAGVFGLLMGCACALGLYIAWWANEPMRRYYERELGKYER